MLHNQPKKRRCSYCRYIGHTKRQCLVLRAHSSDGILESGEDKPLLIKEAKITNKINPTKNIPIQTYGEIKQSKYIVNLQEKKSNHWESVEAYAPEAALAQPFREKIDFGGIVARANIEVVEKKQNKEKLMAISAKVNKFFKAYSLGNLRLFSTRIIEKIVFSAKKIMAAKRFAPLSLAFALVVSLPFPAIGYVDKVTKDTHTVVEESANGFLALQSSTMAAFRADLPQAESDLTKALQSFSSAENFLKNDHELLTSILSVLPVVGSQLESRTALLDAGQHLALGNTYLMKGVERASENQEIVLTDRIGIIRDHLKSALPQYKSALAKLAEVDIKTIPTEYQTAFTQFRLLFAAIVDDLGNVIELANALEIGFGSDSFKRYLIVFQNHHELRPTGGFMGSYAIVDIQKGKILKIEIPPGGTYDLQGQLEVTVKPPLPLQLVNGRWEFQDANWFPDFSASAKKIEWFYSHGRGTSVDGVIAINASVLERLLRVLGPIDQEKYHLLLTSDTVLSSIENVVENGEDKAANRPKAILSDLFSELIEVFRTVKPIDALRLLTELHDSMNQKEIQMYFDDSSVQKIFHRYGWTGEIAPTPLGQDYLSVSIANVQGQKSDAVVDQVIDHQAVVSEDGTVENTVVMRRTHHGDSGGMYGVPNMTYVRIYVPEGAELVSAGGFVFPPDASFHVPEEWYTDDMDLANIEREVSVDPKTGTRVTREFGKTSFGNWVLTKPGETSDVFFTYRLPHRLDMQSEHAAAAPFWQSLVLGSEPKRFSSYYLTLQKQSGTNPIINTRVIYPSSWSPVWKSDEVIDMAKNGTVASFSLTSDKKIGVIMQHQ